VLSQYHHFGVRGNSTKIYCSPVKFLALMDDCIKDMGSTDSENEALCEILGLTSLQDINDFDEPEGDNSHRPLSSDVPCIPTYLCEIYKLDSMCLLPREFSISASFMRRITDELVWSADKYADRTHETVVVRTGSGGTEQRRVLTRLENFVASHDVWKELCYGYLAECVSSLIGEPMVLYKEKLNLKPPGGSGFAPHLDSPSLRVALQNNDGPKTFVTVMVAIDSMTKMNGCLRICKGSWTEFNHCRVLVPEEGANPDAGGRAGAIPTEVAELLKFEDIECQGGDILVFSGWAPHRSAPNRSSFSRRAVFLTYNPKAEGDFHEHYYQRMNELRTQWRVKVGMSQVIEDLQTDLKALTTIPR
jgi:ectoine hydroxylase-related dioxygenase (phytanoyl-CoA dioxygenase family)